MAKILIHARSTDKRHTAYRNWPVENWQALMRSLPQNEFICIGSADGAAYIENAADMRGVSIEQLIDIMRGADLLLSPSSGPAHIAAMCGLPHIVWTDSKQYVMIGGTNRERYEVLWNPYHTPVRVIDSAGWQPTVSDVIRYTQKILSGVIGKVKIKQPKPTEMKYPAVAMVTYERADRFADTIRSLETFGINADRLYIYDDCSQDLKKQAELRQARSRQYNIFINSRRLNVYWNTLQAIDALYNFTDDRVLFYTQDDVQFSADWHKRALDIINDITSDGIDWGILNLWNLKWPTEKTYTVLKSGHGGGVCWAIRREMWKMYRQDIDLYERPLKSRLMDYQICHWCRNNGRREWAVCIAGKSLVQHTGDVSTITDRDMSQFMGVGFTDA